MSNLKPPDLEKLKALYEIVADIFGEQRAVYDPLRCDERIVELFPGLKPEKD